MGVPRSELRNYCLRMQVSDESGLFRAPETTQCTSSFTRIPLSALSQLGDYHEIPRYSRKARAVDIRFDFRPCYIGSYRE